MSRNCSIVLVGRSHPASDQEDGPRNCGASRSVLTVLALILLAWIGLDLAAPGLGAAWAKNGDDEAGDNSGSGSNSGGSENSGSSNGEGSDSDTSGNGGSDNGDSDKEDGEASDDGDSENDSGGQSGSGSDDRGNSGSENEGEDDPGKSSDGSATDSGGASGRGSPGQEILQVRFADGRIEQVVNGRFERTDSRGRIVEQRRASREDLSRIGAYRLETEGAIQSVIQVSGKQSAAQLTDGSGWVETVAQGVYQLVDPNGNQVTRRKATAEDLSRISAMAATR